MLSIRQLQCLPGVNLSYALVNAVGVSEFSEPQEQCFYGERGRAGRKEWLGRARRYVCAHTQYMQTENWYIVCAWFVWAVVHVEIEGNYPLFSWSTGHTLSLDPVAISLHVGSAFPQPPSGIHVRFGFVEEMAELELEVWVDQPSTGERMSGRNNDTENRLTPLHHVQWVTGTQRLHRRTCVNACWLFSLSTHNRR